MPKKKLIETNGKEEIDELTTLDQIMGYNQLSRYNTLSLDVYGNTLNDMNRADLEQEARRVGSMVVEDTGRLRDLLKKEFTAYINTLRKPKHFSRPVKLSKAAKEILQEGR